MWTQTIERNLYNGWVALSCAMLDDTKLLRVATSKRQGGKIVTCATVVIMEGKLGTHRLHADFFEVIGSMEARATKNAIKRSHDELMQDHAGDIISRAIEHYRKG